jgi:hypothetical protein
MNLLRSLERFDRGFESPTQYMDTCVLLICVCVLCVGTGLAMG